MKHISDVIAAIMALFVAAITILVGAAYVLCPVAIVVTCIWLVIHLAGHF